MYSRVLTLLVLNMLSTAYAQYSTTDTDPNVVNQPNGMQPVANTPMQPTPAQTTPGQPNDASAQTSQINSAVLNQLPFSNRTDYDLTKQGFVATPTNLTIKDANGKVIWSLEQYAFLTGKDAPATVNPSLWRQAQLNLSNGLFKVTDRIYQVRGYDLANMDIIEGKKGIIIIDPLTTKETAKAALELYYQNRPKVPVVAVIYTHSHVDHYGGVKGVVSEADVKAGKVKVIAPQGFLEAAVSENVYAGNAMARRAIYMYGAILPKGEKGQVDGALGKTASLGEVTLIPPTDIIKKTGEKRTIDGVEIEFLMAPNTEAPAEMLMYFPQMKALCSAEDAVHTLHNLYTLRGAQVRDAAAWWKVLNEAIETYGSKSEVVFAQHNWPIWGSANIIDFLQKERNMYKYIHDQSLHLINQGYTMTEIGNMISPPPSIANEWYNRGYYGSVNHNAKAVYQRYMGWYSSNPADLNPYPPTENSKRYVEFMGGANAIIQKAREYYNRGDYRFVATVLNHVVMADPSNQAARNLEADALEQLGYQNENATWRNEYLMGAYELRNGVPTIPATQVATADTIKAMPIEMYLDYMGIRLNADRARDKKISLNLDLTDTKQKYVLTLEDSVLVYTPKKQSANADATLALDKATFDALTLKELTMEDAAKNGKLKITGSSDKVREFMGLFDDFPPMFNIITSNMKS